MKGDNTDERREQDECALNRQQDSPLEPFRYGMRVRVSGEQDGLKEHKACVPDCGGPAQQRKQHLRYHGFDQEEERRTEKDRDAEENQDHAMRNPCEADLSIISVEAEDLFDWSM
jgi:hypothetical protein